MGKQTKQQATRETKQSIWSQVDMKAFIPGIIILLVIVAAGIIAPRQFESALTGAQEWIMDHFKWLYILCVILVVAFCLFLLCSKYGNVRLGGKKAKPSIKTSTWCTLSLTGTIAVGICFYSVSAPVDMFMNPPEFLGVQGGTAEAIIPTLKYCFLHYGLPPYFLITVFALIIALVYYNGKQPLRGGSTLYPLVGAKRSNGWAGNIINTLQIIALIVCGTNMGLAVIQLNSGIGTVTGASGDPNFQVPIIIFYTLLTIFFACSGVHKWMGTLSNINALCYFAIVIFVLLVGPTNRLLGLEFTSVGEFIRDFIPMISFSDSIMQTGWQNSNTMYFFAWNIAPAFLHALFFVSICYGRTLRQFILVNCIVPVGLVFTWYTTFGASAMIDILNGSDIYQQIQQYGDGVATFAFLNNLPAGTILKWGFIVLAIMTFITFSDSIAFSFPMLLMKDTETDAAKTKTPKIFNVAVSVFMGVFTAILLYAGGYNALSQVMVVFALPCVIAYFFIMASGMKFLFNRKKYDVTYQEDLAEEEAEFKEKVRQAALELQKDQSKEKSKKVV